MLLFIVDYSAIQIIIHSLSTCHSDKTKLHCAHRRRKTRWAENYSALTPPHSSVFFNLQVKMKNKISFYLSVYYSLHTPCLLFWFLFLPQYRAECLRSPLGSLQATCGALNRDVYILVQQHSALCCEHFSSEKDKKRTKLIHVTGCEII